MLTLFTLNSSKKRAGYQQAGFSVMEVMIASSLGVMLVGMALAAVGSNRRLYKYDLVRTKINQNVRGALDILGSDIREAGENLNATFPAIEIINGASGAPDELIVRRNLLDEVLKVCTTITAAGGDPKVYFGLTVAAPAGCDYGSQAQNFSAWHAHRVAQSGAVADAYVYDPTTHFGEFFKFTTETNSGTTYYVTANDGVWAHDYTNTASAVYMLEEWHYKLNAGVLQLIINNDTANPLNVVFDVSDFQISATLSDGSVLSSMGVSDDWTKIKFLEVNLRGTDSAFGDPVNRTLTARYFPRNVLSH